VDADTELIPGATVLGVSGDEVINMFAASMSNGRACCDHHLEVRVHPAVSKSMPWILDDLRPLGSRGGGS
jgi:pyruvate/2-oxoglutarate dehydrogenase complex dihydrolipoamide dehydrogenase (E3) component